MPTTCLITFDNPDGVYYAGQMLHGTVALTLTSEKKVRGVFVKVFGRAYASWTEHCSTDHNPTRDSNGNLKFSNGHTVKYIGEEDYLNEKTYFVGGENAESFNMEPGTYNYTFQCLLPAGLPTSVQHEIGHITYGANVVMDIPFWTDKEFARHFTVIKPINLNYSPVYRFAARNTSEQSFNPMGIFCCCPDGPLAIECRTPVQGYTPGQTINVSIIVNNASSYEVTDFEVQLNKQITFHGRAREAHHNETSTKVADETIREKMINGCRGGSETTAHVNLQVPSIPPTDFSTSNIVKVYYTIRIAGTVDGCCNSIDAHDLPITIGTIPIQDNFDAPNMNANPTVISGQPTSSQNGTPAPMPDDPPSYAIASQEPFPTVPTAPNMPDAPNMPTAPTATDGPSALSAPSPPIDFGENPPTYEEAINMGGEASNDGFRPKYPIFRRQTSYSNDDDSTSAPDFVRNKRKMFKLRRNLNSNREFE